MTIKKLTTTVIIEIYEDGSCTTQLSYEGGSPVLGLQTTLAVISGLEISKQNLIMERYALLPGSIAEKRVKALKAKKSTPKKKAAP